MKWMEACYGGLALWRGGIDINKLQTETVPAHADYTNTNTNMYIHQ
jgi:hypothetical protein